MTALARSSFPGDFAVSHDSGQSYAFWTQPTSGSIWFGPGADQGRDIEDSIRVGQVAGQFRQLATRWLEETALVSSVDEMKSTPTFAHLVSLGMPAVPLALQEMMRDTGYWFPVLQEMAGTDPVDPQIRGDVRQMADAWINWGRGKGLA